MDNEEAQTTLKDEKGLMQFGGIAAIAITAGYLITFPIYAWVGDAPAGGVEVQLRYFADHALGWWIILGLMVLTDLLYVPVFLALYQVLKGVRKSIMLLALACVGLFITLDLSLTWTSYSALLRSGNLYAAAATDVQRAAAMSAAGYPSVMLDSPLLGTYAILFPSLGIFLTGYVMRKGVLNQLSKFLAISTGLTGVFFMASYFVKALGLFRIVNALLAMIWFLVIGVWMVRYSRQITTT